MPFVSIDAYYGNTRLKSIDTIIVRQMALGTRYKLKIILMTFNLIY